MTKNTESFYNEEEQGLACPPMDPYAMSDAFYYGDRHCAGMNLDQAVFFADVSEEQEDGYSHKKKPLVTRYNGKGKEWKNVVQVLKPDPKTLAKVNAALETIRCHPAVEGVTVQKTTCAPPVTKAMPEIKKVKRQVNVVSQSSSMHKKNNLTETRRPDISMPMTEKAFELKLEATKRKLRDSYDQANKLKKQRTTQFIDLQHLPPMQTTNNKRLKAKPKPKVTYRRRGY